MRKSLLVGFFVVTFLVSGPAFSHADDACSSPDQAKKLDQILANQQQILDAVADVKNELRVIKARSTP